MFDKIAELIQSADLIAVVFALIVVVLASVKNYMVAEVRLKTSYYLMIALGVAQSALNTYLAAVNTGQEILFLMNVPAVWVILMGHRGLRKLKDNG